MSFWDSSALVPLCTNEPRSISAGRLWKGFPQKFVWCKENPKGKNFVSGDEKLIKVAEAIGFTTHLL